jgi:NADH:ubiquinone oxidoreductase subunit 4 (subunit M)
MHKRELYIQNVDKSLHLTVPQDLNRRELVLLVTLLIPTILLGICPGSVLESLHIAVNQLIYTI